MDPEKINGVPVTPTISSSTGLIFFMRWVGREVSLIIETKLPVSYRHENFLLLK